MTPASYQLGLGIVAALTQDELPDEAIEQVLQLAGLVRAVHDEAVVLRVKLHLGAKLAAKILARI